MRILVDVMGSDRGPREVIAGILLALRDHADIEAMLVGDQIVVQEALDQNILFRGARERVSILHAGEVIGMGEKIDSIRRKPDASLVRAAEALRDGRADALVAVGNTAAAVAVTQLRLGTLKGVARAGIAVTLPSMKGPCVVIDCGANTAPQPAHLAIYGLMASRYAETVLGCPHPEVGLLNVGGEAGKGNEFLRRSYDLLGRQPINFIGNVEGNDIFLGRARVVVCDGVVGNAVLKAAEGVGTMFLSFLRQELGRGAFVKFGAALCHRAFRAVRARADYATYGGAPLLGLNGVCIIGHGRSDAVAVSNAVRVAKEVVAARLNKSIVGALAPAASPAG